MTDADMPGHPADHAIAAQVSALADAAFGCTEPIDLPSTSRVQDDRIDGAKAHRSPTRRTSPLLVAAAAMVVVLGGFVALWLDSRGVTELQTAGQPAPTVVATAVGPPADVPGEVVALRVPAPISNELPVDLGELAMGPDAEVVLSRGEAVLALEPREQTIVSRNRGLGWVTFHAPVSTARSGCMNADDTDIVGVSLRDDDQQWFTTHRHAGANEPTSGGTDAILPEAFASIDRTNLGRWLYCRPARVGDRWATAMSDGRLLTVYGASTASGSRTVSVLTLPDELQGSASSTSLFADGDRFVAEICMVVENLCSTTIVSFPATALDDSDDPFVHTLSGDEDPTMIAERYRVPLRDLLAANPQIVRSQSPGQLAEWKIPGLGRIDPANVEVGAPFFQGHPSLYEGYGSTWQVTPVDVAGDPELIYASPGIYAVSRFGDDPVPLPENEVWRVDVYPDGDRARVRVWTTSPYEEPTEQRWYQWDDEDRTWGAISDPVVDWPTLADWNAPVSFVELAPSGRIRVILRDEDLTSDS